MNVDELYTSVRKVTYVHGVDPIVEGAVRGMGRAIHEQIQSGELTHYGRSDDFDVLWYSHSNGHSWPKICCIKHARKLFGLGLKESKELCEAVFEGKDTPLR